MNRAPWSGVLSISLRSRSGFTATFPFSPINETSRGDNRVPVCAWTSPATSRAKRSRTGRGRGTGRVLTREGPGIGTGTLDTRRSVYRGCPGRFRSTSSLDGTTTFTLRRDNCSWCAATWTRVCSVRIPARMGRSSRRRGAGSVIGVTRMCESGLLRSIVTHILIRSHAFKPVSHGIICYL